VGNNTLFQFIVPLAFLAIWALTSLFNREAQPLPPRAGGRPLDPNGPRPQPAPGAPRPGERRPDFPAREPADRWSAPSGQDRPASYRPQGREDGIVILEAQTRRPAPGAPGRPGTVKRAPRSKANPPAPAKRPEASTPRALSASMGQPIAPLVNRPVELKPLAGSQPASPLTSAETQTLTRPTAVASQAGAPGGVSAGDLRQWLASPAKVRDGVVLGEVLRRPPGLRGRGRRSI
jgi:hypothetical protein